MILNKNVFRHCTISYSKRVHSSMRYWLSGLNFLQLYTSSVRSWNGSNRTEYLHVFAFSLYLITDTDMGSLITFRYLSFSSGKSSITGFRKILFCASG